MITKTGMEFIIMQSLKNLTFDWCDKYSKTYIDEKPTSAKSKNATVLLWHAS